MATKSAVSMAATCAVVIPAIWAVVNLAKSPVSNATTPAVVKAAICLAVKLCT